MCHEGLSLYRRHLPYGGLAVTPAGQARTGWKTSSSDRPTAGPDAGPSLADLTTSQVNAGMTPGMNPRRGMSKPTKQSRKLEPSTWFGQAARYARSDRTGECRVVSETQGRAACPRVVDLALADAMCRGWLSHGRRHCPYGGLAVTPVGRARIGWKASPSDRLNAGPNSGHLLIDLTPCQVNAGMNPG